MDKNRMSFFIFNKMLLSPDVYFTVLDPETNKRSRVEVRSVDVIDVVKGDARVYINLTDEQKQIKNPQFFIHKLEYELPPLQEYNRNNFPVEHARPPKPTKKWSRRKH